MKMGLRLFVLALAACSSNPMDLPMDPGSPLGPKADGFETPRELSDVERRLYANLVANQEVNDDGVQRVGSWSTELTLTRIGPVSVPRIINVEETNAFLPLKVLLSLEEASYFVDLPDHAVVRSLGDHLMTLYREESESFFEPAGTINYYPVLFVDRDGNPQRGVEQLEPFDLLNGLNIPNEFDTSSQYCLWLLASGQDDGFCEAMIRTAGDYRDVDRTRQHAFEDDWKTVNSGAFLTWAETEFGDGNRIPAVRFTTALFSDEANDVDCVVNLNLLSAIGHYQSYYPDQELPPATAAGVESACALIEQALVEGTTTQCGVYYDHDSQFLAAYAEAFSSGVSCLWPSVSAAQDLLERAAADEVREFDSSTSWTAVAEYLTALKKLHPAPEARPTHVVELIDQLERGLRELAVDDEGALTSRDSLFYGTMASARADWFSEAASTATALRALALP